VPSEEIIVLACSMKTGGRCVAGISTETGEWVRPVYDLDEGQLAPHHYLVNGREPRLLDVVRFEHEGPADDPVQPENVLIRDEPLEAIGRVAPDDAYRRLSPHLVDGPELFGNFSDSVSESEAELGVPCSLALIEPQSLWFELRQPWMGRGRSKPRALFELSGSMYDFGLTDRVVRPRLFRAAHGTHTLPELDFAPPVHTLLTVSLGGVFRGSCWKLAAGVVFLP
jgi:hypothetical protein